VPTQPDRTIVNAKDQISPVLDEQGLIQRARNGELDAFNQLVLKYQQMAYSVAYRLLQEEGVTADTVQESFLKAYRALASFQGGNFKSWLMRIVVNSSYDVLRLQQRESTTSLDNSPIDVDYAAHLVDRSEGPEAHAERMELNHYIELGIRALPPDQRTVLVLCDIQGYSYEEITEITGFAMGTVKSRISRARSKLRDYLLQKPELLPTTFRP
jgi:RNA polymerase sigma-70 factor (ECF subfamily)